MPIEKSLLMLITHLIPILFFMYIASELFIRNRKNFEHILLALISFCYMMLFTAEFVRNQVSIEYSPIISSIWFSSFGILIPVFGIHFFIKFTNLDKLYPKFISFFLILNYSPIIFIVLNIILKAQLFSAHQFQREGFWIAPIYNFEYYITMIIGICSQLACIIILYIVLKLCKNEQQISIYQFMIKAILISFIIHIPLGFFNFGKYLPPYPYIYAGIVWCYFLKIAMMKHDFLSFYDYRFQKLFEINPNMILLFTKDLKLVNKNPKTIQFFEHLQVDFQQFYDLLDEQVKNSIKNGTKLYNYETEIEFNNQRYYLLVHSEYMEIDYNLHILLIVQDITQQKQQQEEIQFYANHDPLTHLPNRRYFYTKIHDELEEATLNEQEVGIFLVDLNNFKMLNDQLGHHIGDEVLVKVANILKDISEPNGFACRLGGDEFLFFKKMPSIEQEIEPIIQQINLRFIPISQDVQNIPLDFSIGVSIYPKESSDISTLIQIADKKMYEMKYKKKNMNTLN